MTQSQLPSVLLRRARAWAGQLTLRARAYAPAHVRPAISSHVEDKNEGTYIIRITANRKVAPDARAQEYGSGLRARRGAKKTYKIIGQPWLAFYVGGGKGSAFGAFDPSTRKGVGERNIVVTHEVDHPGIQAANNGKGYIAPAVNELRKIGKAELQQEIKQAILGDIRRSFGTK